jgi:DNA modification methylase
MPNKFENPENISRLPLGKIHTIITSPPYQNALHDSLEKREAWESRKLHDAKKGLPVGYSENADNIGNIKEHGSVDVILTSPPYADGKKAGEVKPDEVEKYAKRWDARARGSCLERGFRSDLGCLAFTFELNVLVRSSI